MGKTLRHQHCPRCGGRVFLHGDHFGWYVQCFWCAATFYLRRDTLEVGKPVQETGGTTGGSDRSNSIRR